MGVKEWEGKHEGGGGKKRNFHGGKRLCISFPGLSKVPLQHNKTKQQKEPNRLWSDFLGARNLLSD